MGDIGRERCAEYGVSWRDLSGNARIVAPGLRILIDGKPKRYKRRGRPSTAFAPKSYGIDQLMFRVHLHQWVFQLRKMPNQIPLAPNFIYFSFAR